MPTKMQICYNIATSYGDLRKYTVEENIEKEIAEYIAMRGYTNIGNSMCEIGRYITAIDCFSNALLIKDVFAMAILNLSFTLFRYH